MNETIAKHVSPSLLEALEAMERGAKTVDVQWIWHDNQWQLALLSEVSTRLQLVNKTGTEPPLYVEDFPPGPRAGRILASPETSPMLEDLNVELRNRMLRLESILASLASQLEAFNERLTLVKQRLDKRLWEEELNDPKAKAES
jgi:hypothetical protein